MFKAILGETRELLTAALFSFNASISLSLVGNLGLGTFETLLLKAVAVVVSLQIALAFRGEHLNNAVTLLMAAAEEFSPLRAIFMRIPVLYVGTTLGRWLYHFATPVLPGILLGSTAPTPQTGFNVWEVALAEVITTMCFIAWVLRVVQKQRNAIQTALAVPFGLFLPLVVAIPVSGGAVNGALAFAWQLVDGKLGPIWGPGSYWWAYQLPGVCSVLLAIPLYWFMNQILGTADE